VSVVKDEKTDFCTRVKMTQIFIFDEKLVIFWK